jgi:hypothetical protein
MAAAAFALCACDVGSPPSGAASAGTEGPDESTSARFARPPLFEASAAARSSGAGEDVARLEQEVAELRQDIAALRAEVAIGGGGLPPGAGGHEAAVLADAAQLAAAEKAFRGEAVDPDWSPAMADAVRATVSQVDRSHLPPRSVECRSQSCRVELADGNAPPSAADLALVLDRFVQTLPRATAGLVDAADGHKVTVVYLAR